MKRLDCVEVTICSKTYTANSKCSIDSILNNTKAEESYDHELASQVFYWAQVRFPRICKHIEGELSVYMGAKRDHWSAKRRNPNWKFCSGKEVKRYSLNCNCLLYTSPSPRDQRGSRMPSSA